MNISHISDNLSPELFSKFSRLIFQLSGIYMKDSKIVLLSNRLRKRMQVLNISSYEEYYNYLLTHKEEYENFINVISTNETYFFRSESQIESFSNMILPLIINRKGYARIWSAGCSTGEEPYSLAIVADNIGVLNKVDILATDINSEVIEKAKKGIYNLRRLKYVDQNTLKKYFTKIDEENYKISSSLSAKINFKIHNLIKDEYPKNLDIIFCRNVMIYFNRDIQKEIVDKFYNSIDKGGFFFIGHAETLYVISDKFKYLKIGNSSVYYKE